MANDGDNYRTPEWLYRALDVEFAFTIDVAANADNHKTSTYITAREDALSTTWSIGHGASPAVAWCNPPYSKPNIGRFLERAWVQAQSGVTSVMLVPNDPSTAWAKWVVDKAAEIRFLVPGRIRFDNADGTPAPDSSSKASAIIVYRPRYRGKTLWREWLREELIVHSATEETDE